MTIRQQKILKMIIEDYIANGTPVGSKTLIKEHSMDLSPATIRNEMAALEKEGFLEKAHTSSGRVPSLKGYEFYAKNQADKENKDLTRKLEKIFMKRKVSIDLTLDEAANAISEIAGLTLVTSSSENDELMKSIQLTPINDKMATIVIVTSTGRVESKLIEFNDNVKIEDVRIAVRLFKERLIDSKLIDLPLKVEAMAPILSDNVKNYEAVIQAFVGKVFDFHNRVQNKVYGNNALVEKKEIKREDLAGLLDLISSKSVWEAIENDVDEDEKMKIEIRPNNTSLISKKIDTGKSIKEIAIVGSNRLDYSEAKQAINILESFFKKEGTMNRIGWFKRLFMSYDDLARHFQEGNNNETLTTVKETYSKLTQTQDATILDLRSQLEELRRVQIQLKERYENQKQNSESKDGNIKMLNDKISELQVRLDERTKETNVIRDDIRDQLKTIGKIESTFFAKTGNKGKGELGERQVKTILEKSGLPADMWVENLSVNSKTVEFAMQSGEEGKFIPIDSKVLDADVDEQGNIEVNSAYKTKVETQVKEVKKYLSKSNTADYGIIVLQSDDIYMKLFEEYPQFFNEMIEKHRVYVNSPSSFIQTAWSISNLIKIYTRVKNDEKIYEEMQDALISVGKFASSLSKVHKDFNVAMDTHYPTIERRHANLVKRLDKEGKLKAIPEIKGDK